MKKIKVIIVIMTFVCLITANVHAREILREKINNKTFVVSQSRETTLVKWNGRVYGRYDFSGKAKLISEQKLTTKMLLKRKNKILYIERIIGKVVDRKLNGKTACGNYISYRSLKGYARKGDIIVTYCVYNPYTHWTDDIDHRFDVIL